MTKPAPVAVALDAPDLETAARWAALVTPHVSTVKVGLELYLRYGPQVVATVRGAELPGLNHRFEVVSGVREDACRELIQAFFRDRRS